MLCGLSPATELYELTDEKAEDNCPCHPPQFFLHRKGVGDLQACVGRARCRAREATGAHPQARPATFRPSPETACIGRELAASTPQEPTARGGAPIFRYGSGSSNVLHALLEHRVTPFRLLVGHSKGALQINNAIQSLPATRTQGLRVVTLGCPIGENVGGVDYHQYLGLFDALGQLNAWGHWPDYWPPTWHSTNPVLPPAMAVGKMTSESVRD